MEPCLKGCLIIYTVPGCTSQVQRREEGPESVPGEPTTTCGLQTRGENHSRLEVYSLLDRIESEVPRGGYRRCNQAPSGDEAMWVRRPGRTHTTYTNSPAIHDTELEPVTSHQHAGCLSGLDCSHCFEIRAGAARMAGCLTASNPENTDAPCDTRILPATHPVSCLIS